MTKAIKISASVVLMILSWLLIGFGFTTPLGHPTSTVCLLAGMGIFGGSLALLIVSIVRK